jgi:hypothetical protein
VVILNLVASVGALMLKLITHVSEINLRINFTARVSAIALRLKFAARVNAIASFLAMTYEAKKQYRPKSLRGTTQSY